MKEQKGWDGRNAILDGQGLLIVGVDFADFDAAIVFVSQFIQDGCECSAGVAPLGPEIHQHGGGRLENFRRKILLSQSDDVICGHKELK